MQKNDMRGFFRSYHTPGQSHLHPRKKNAIFISNSNTIRHELSKCLGAIMVRRYGDLYMSETIIKALKDIEREIIKRDFAYNPTEFITEACPNKLKNRRVDLVDIDNNIRYEFETNKAIRKEDTDATIITIYI